MKKIVLSALVAISALYANSVVFTSKVKVTSSEPQYRTITRRVPYQECWNEKMAVSNSSSNGTLGALIGGVAGGVLGHQVGGGSGKTAATVGGAIVGTLVGKNLSQNSNTGGQQYKVRRKCITKYNQTKKREFVGYINHAKYYGKIITQVSTQPLQYIRVNIVISPVKDRDDFTYQQQSQNDYREQNYREQEPNNYQDF